MPAGAVFFNWVRGFLRMNLSGGLSNEDRIEQYSEALAVDEALEDWQREQGRKAVELYLNMFLKDQGNVAGKDAVTHPRVLEKMRTALRLKHYAYLSVDETKRLFDRVEGRDRMILELIYGAGLRLSELTRMRSMSIDFDNTQIHVRDGKGGKDRVVPQWRKSPPATRLPERFLSSAPAGGGIM